MTKVYCLIFCLFAFSKAFAIESFISTGYGAGGTNLSDLTGGQNYHIEAGSGLFLSGGIILPISPTVPHRFELQIGVGYLFQDDAKEKENSLSWKRLPFEMIYFYHNTQENFRFGWGPVFHFNNTITAKGANSSASALVDNAFGWAIAVEKMFNADQDSNFWSLGLKYNFIKYHSANFTRDADGNCIFLTLSAFLL